MAQKAVKAKRVSYATFKLSRHEVSGEDVQVLWMASTVSFQF